MDFVKALQEELDSSLNALDRCISSSMYRDGLGQSMMRGARYARIHTSSATRPQDGGTIKFQISMDGINWRDLDDQGDVPSLVRVVEDRNCPQNTVYDGNACVGRIDKIGAEMDEAKRKWWPG